MEGINITDKHGNQVTYVSYFYYKDYIISKYGVPLAFWIGVSGNLFAVLSMIFRRLYKAPMFVFFVFMTSMDTVKVATEGGIFFVRLWIYEYPITSADANNIHGWSFVMVRYLGDSAMIASTWILIFATGYKLYALLYPLKLDPSKRIFALVSCFVIVVITFGINSYMIWTYTIVDVYITNTTFYTRLAFVEEYAYFVNYIFLPLALCVYSIIPGCILTILSICIIFSVYNSYRKYKQMMHTDSNTPESSTYKTAKRSIMALIPLSVVHVSCSMPIFIVLLSVGQAAFGYELFLLMVLNHSVNVYVQMIFSKFYRDSLLGRTSK